jgi:hypothetical protein
MAAEQKQKLEQQLWNMQTPYVGRWMPMILEITY